MIEAIRNILNSMPLVTWAVAAMVFVIGVYLVLHSSGDSLPKRTSDPYVFKAFYSDDDGASVFLDVQGKPIPFDHNGNPAYPAVVLTCDGGVTHFVGLLQRPCPSGTVSAADTESQSASSQGLQRMEVKLPGAGNEWKAVTSAEMYEMINTIRPPAGMSGKAQILYP